MFFFASIKMSCNTYSQNSNGIITPRIIEIFRDKANASLLYYYVIKFRSFGYEIEWSQVDVNQLMPQV